MSAILMLKDKEVYNLDREFVYNYDLLPIAMKYRPCKETFNIWWRSRKSSSTNVTSRMLSSKAFGNNKKIIDLTTRGLSLSDCYWIKKSEDNVKFEEVSPYYADFWKGTGVYEGNPIPTLYVDGYLTKEWVSSELLKKPHNDTEYEAYLLGSKLGMDVAHYAKGDNCIFTKNFTNTQLMLEQAVSDSKYRNDEYDSLDIINDFTNGFDMLVLDAIVGNGDRHTGNFGWLVDTDTGNIVKSAPIYDFDHALDSKNPRNCILIKEIIDICKNNNEYSLKIIEYCNKTIELNINQFFNCRAEYILENKK